MKLDLYYTLPLPSSYREKNTTIQLVQSRAREKGEKRDKGKGEGREEARKRKKNTFITKSNNIKRDTTMHLIQPRTSKHRLPRRKEGKREKGKGERGKGKGERGKREGEKEAHTFITKSNHIK
jgi:hypothetical protein